MPKPSRFSRIGRKFGVIALAIALLPSPARTQSCDIPSFSTKPFAPIPGVAGVPSALAAGTFYRHAGETGCSCDLAVTVSGAKDLLVILRGEDSGAFLALPENPVISVGANPIGLVSGRFVQSRAGDLDDLVVASGTPAAAGRVSLFAPDANGRYQQVGPDIMVAAGPRSIVAGHFNNDVNLDLAILSTTNAVRSLTVLFGDGKGGFAAESRQVLAISDQTVWSMAAGRFQGHAGVDDVAIAHSDANANVRVSIARRAAAGGFQFLAPPLSVGSGGRAHLAVGTLGGPPGGDQDLVVAFEDAKGGGHVAIIRGGTEVARTSNFDGTPRSIHVADLNSDNKEDLILSVFSSADIANPDGRITVFRGEATTLVNFDARLWETPPSPILPRAVVTGRFGLDRATRVRHTGLAAVNAPPLNTVSTYVGNGAGAFAAPSGFVTAVEPGAKLIVQGDFDAIANNDKVLDLAYVRRDPDGEHVLTVLLSNGERTFRRVPSGIRVGRAPLMMIAGRFDTDQIIDIAVVDANPGDSLGRPRLRIWLGDGKGGFLRPPGVADFLLDGGEAPVGIAIGQFRNVSAKRPSDVAIVSKTTSGRGTLKLYLNDLKGQFEIKSTTLTFSPAAVAVSNRFREDDIYDIVIEHEGSARFSFLENRGDGEFVRSEVFGHPSGSARPAGRHLVGDVTADDLDDIVQVYEDRTVGVFRNTGSGRFVFSNVEALKSLAPAFNPAGASFFLEKFANGPPALLGVVRPSTGPVAIVAARSDGAGGFVNGRVDVLELPPGDGLEFVAKPPRTRFSVDNLSQAGSSRIDVEPLTTSAFAGQFAHNVHGNSHNDIGFLASVARNTVIVAGACPTDPLPTPRPIEKCTDSEPNAFCNLPCPSPQCTAAKAQCNALPVCQEPPCQPRPRTCTIRCPPECVLTSQRPFCETGANGLYLIVFRNTCGG